MGSRQLTEAINIAMNSHFALRRVRAGSLSQDNRSYATSRTLTKMLPTDGEKQTAVLGKDPEKWRPTTRETADHSLPYTVARALLDGEITTAWCGRTRR